VPAPSADAALEAKRARFALGQLSIGEQFLAAKKPGIARKEFNRARMAWSSATDLSRAPAALEHEALALPPDALRRFVDTRALHGVARTFLAVVPPQRESAIAKLREALDIDRGYGDAIALLAELGVSVSEESFPDFADPRLVTQLFWMKEGIPWEKRGQFAAHCREEGNAAFARRQYRDAMAAYNRGLCAFAGQSGPALSDAQRLEISESLIVNRLNLLACFFELGNYQQVIVNAVSLVETIDKSPSPMPDRKVKCLFRKARAYLKQDREDRAEETVAELSRVPGSESAVAGLRALIDEQKKAHQLELDGLYKKMATT
jgi:tetratricopeptide (TPR) repeat protein